MTPRALAWILTAVMAASVCGSVLGIPVQVTDSLVPILQAQQTPSMAAAFGSSVGAGYLRPLRIVQIQALFDVSRGHYYLVYKTFHLALVLGCFLLFAVAVDVQSAAGAAALSFALTVLVGLHTFRGLVWEAYPINHFLEIVDGCLLALVLARSRGGWWADLAAALTFVVASLTLESGLLVWVVVVAARIAGYRGVSRRGVAILTALVAGYLLVRFPYLGTGAPTLAERSSGYGFGRLDPGELIRRFGEWPYGYYAYNVISSGLSVLLSEPRAGVWVATAGVVAGGLPLGTVLNVASSLATTGVIAGFAAAGARRWRRGEVTDGDRMCAVALAVLAANAALSYGYTKDEIMSPAGVFYALAAYVAIRDLLAASTRRSGPRTRHVAYAVALATAAAGFGVRTVGLHYQMQRMAFTVRNEWVYVDDWLTRQHATPVTDEGRRIVAELKADALARGGVNPYLQAQASRLARIFP